MARLSRASEVIMVNLINCYLFTSVRSSNSFTVSKASRVVSFTSTTSPVSSMGPKKIPLKTGLTPARINLCAPIVLLCPPCHHPPRERRHQGEDQSLKRGSSANQSPSQTSIFRSLNLIPWSCSSPNWSWSFSKEIYNPTDLLAFTWNYCCWWHGPLLWAGLQAKTSPNRYSLTKINHSLYNCIIVHCTFN